MKKYLLVFLAVVAFCAAPALAAEESIGEAAATAPQDKLNPIDIFTGKHWIQSTGDNKEAYILGIESAIAVEHYINQSMVASAAKSGKKPVYTLSPFEKGWMEAFRDTTRREMVKEIDKWYEEHPDNLDRTVMSVIWYGLIEPRLKAAGK